MHHVTNALTHITVRVGYTTQRPIVVDQHFSYVTVGTNSFTEASLVAAQQVGARKGVVMVTSTDPWVPAVVTTGSDTLSDIRRILAMEG